MKVIKYGRLELPARKNYILRDRDGNLYAMVRRDGGTECRALTFGASLPVGQIERAVRRFHVKRALTVLVPVCVAAFGLVWVFS